MEDLLLDEKYVNEASELAGVIDTINDLGKTERERKILRQHFSSTVDILLDTKMGDKEKIEYLLEKSRQVWETLAEYK